MTCIKCGKETGMGAAFCSACGAKQVETFRQQFVRGRKSEKDFIAEINAWLRANPNAANIQCYMESKTAIGCFVNKSNLKVVEFEYEVANGANANRYCFLKESCVKLYAKSCKKVLEQWKEKHPNAKVVTWKGCTHSRGDAGSLVFGGIGAMNRTDVYIFYKISN